MKIKYYIFALGLIPVAAGAQTLPYQDTSLSFEERAADLVSRMTISEKIEQLGHVVPAIDRLGLKAYNYWNEALHGVARKGVATVFPSSRAMSSTWNLDLVSRAAVITGNECRVKDIQNPNNPNMNGLIY